MAEEKNKPYRVLARKYRPQNFDELIGQDALVRTLQNAITSGRIAHAFMLTGVRGVGKTTTARIIAKALNYKGPDGKSEATTGDTSDCQLCQAISEDRHPDVIEMDAASRTGVDDIREILDGVRYAPTEARYKIYVIDEVHMLSKNAFNALLKTLEEPPEHVKFIFATTEIRKVPITVLSRCQRFDLNRVGADILIPHFKSICDKEGVKAEDDAISLIARAADGSVRDGLSLLDQAIALAGESITSTLVQDMLGLADRGKNLDLLEHALTGRTKEALDIMDYVHKNGGAPSVVIQDLLDLTHLLTRLRAVPDFEDTNQALSGDQLTKAKDLAQKLSMPTLSKTWQILLKGLAEVNEAPNPQNAGEMVIIRLAYAANLPDPSDLIKKLKDNPAPQNTGAPNTPSHNGGSNGGNVHAQDFTPPQYMNAPAGPNGQETAHAAPMLSVVQNPAPIKSIQTMEDVVSLLRAHQEIAIAEHLVFYAHPVKIKQGHVQIRLKEDAPPDLSQNLKKSLQSITNENWMVVISNDRGSATLGEIQESKRLQELADVAKMPVVETVLNVFPEAELVKILPKEEPKEQEQPTEH
ncbi:MAG: DNA polymerase III subunit gamma/tau [Alphaproteobacteria bacterium]